MQTTQDADHGSLAAASPSARFALPETGEALITAKMFAAAMQVSESSLWSWAKSDPEFPRPVRRGERFTRFKLSDARAYIDSLTEGVAKPLRKRVELAA